MILTLIFFQQLITDMNVGFLTATVSFLASPVYSQWHFHFCKNPVWSPSVQLSIHGNVGTRYYEVNKPNHLLCWCANIAFRSSLARSWMNPLNNLLLSFVKIHKFVFSGAFTAQGLVTLSTYGAGFSVLLCLAILVRSEYCFSFVKFQSSLFWRNVSNFSHNFCRCLNFSPQFR